MIFPVYFSDIVFQFQFSENDPISLVIVIQIVSPLLN